MLTGKQLEYIHALKSYGWNQEQLDSRQEELENEDHPAHKEALEDFCGFLLNRNFITPAQYVNMLNELFPDFTMTVEEVEQMLRRGQ